MIFSIVVTVVYGLIAASVILLLLVMRWPSYRTYRLIQKLEGPGWPLLGASFIAASTKPVDLLDTLKKFLDMYPRYLKTWLMGVPLVALKEPEDLEVLLSSTQHIKKGFEYDPLIVWLKEGLLTSTGEKWHARRKMLTNTFHFRILEDTIPVFNKNAILLTKKMLTTDEKVFDVENLIKPCTLDVICESAMGVSLGAQTNQGIEYVTSIERISGILVKRALHFYLQPPIVFYASPYGIIFRKMMKKLSNFTNKVINDRRWKYYSKVQTEGTAVKKRQAFLDTLLEVEKNNPGLLTQDDIKQEVDTFTFEGHDTTSAAIVFCLFLLGHHQDIQDKVAEEMFEIFESSDREVELKDLQKMSYLEMVIKETLRLFPSVPYISRFLTQDLILWDGLIIPKGTNIVIIPFFLHRHPKYYPDPEKFDPDRFSPEESKNRHPFIYIPFSAGPRNCIGQKFAMMELKIVLSTILRKCKIVSVTKREDIKLIPSLIIRPHIPIKLKVTPRNLINLD